MTRREFKTLFLSALQPLYDSREATAIFRLYLTDRIGIEPHRFLMEPDQEMDSPIDHNQDIKRLAEGEPLQYVTGRTEFCGLDLHVDSRALIPRPETEELVGRILNDYRDTSGISALDIGTGSGAIAIALARHLPNASVDAIDLSPSALQLARENAERHHVSVRFLCQDILLPHPLDRTYHLIVSNPPYIPRSDRENMHKNVRDYEPDMALFVPDEDPLLFYRAIIRNASQALKPSGRLYFETYENYHAEILELMRQAGFSQSESATDLFGRPRFVIGKLCTE